MYDDCNVKCEETACRENKHFLVLKCLSGVDDAINTLEQLMDKINGHPRPKKEPEGTDCVKDSEPSLCDVLNELPGKLNRQETKIREYIANINEDLF